MIRAIDWRTPQEALESQSPEQWLRGVYATLSNGVIMERLQEIGFTGATLKAVRRKAERMGLTKPLREHPAPKFGARPVTNRQGDFDWRTTIQAATALQAQRADLDFSENLPEPVEIETNGPIAVCFSADWHLGAGATDHETWQRDIDYLLQTPSLYYAIIGDEIENVRSFMNVKTILDQVLPPDLQRQVLKAVVRELLDYNKLLWTTWGNHSVEFDERVLGESLMDDFLRETGVPHIGGIGLVRLIVGGQMYTILATHKSRFRSYRNALHGAKRMYETVFPADLVVVAHDHNPGHEEFNHYNMARDMGLSFGGTSYLVACSTYRTLSTNDWAARRFPSWGEGVLKRETAVLFPDRHQIEMYDNCESAIERIRSAEEA